MWKKVLAEWFGVLLSPLRLVTSRMTESETHTSTGQNELSGRKGTASSLRLIVLEPRGFCAGVRMAIEALEEALRRFGPPVYVYHEIVHNRAVVESFRQQGVIFVNDLEKVPPGSILLYSAHGVSPEIRRQAAERRLRTIDATCPLVMKVHRRARELAEQGFKIILIGHPGHEEIVGTIGEAPEAIHLVSSAEDVEQLNLPESSKLAYLTQTTLSLEDVRAITAKLRERYPNIVGPPEGDLCYATQNRQEAVRAIAREVDVVLVVGSPNSSNSRRLMEIARGLGTPAYLIDSAAEIDRRWVASARAVALTAGASAPEKLVQECVLVFVQEFGATVESRRFCEENVRFALPRELRQSL
ncbi:MAG: 4-hydroxy-3-methylbut-2-enyl diphosphate reductase [Thermoguttaceae bacterium]|nr:4-hydroxy-3-methylbut-2-enyl diphosphate reductase [Thermoguttaceae bacterium]MDW8078467.1 4-hydroxy-3-methylbut-2-enyl diphosphate reductase [Thermoguttaceae bacterium]